MGDREARQETLQNTMVLAVANIAEDGVIKPAPKSISVAKRKKKNVIGDLNMITTPMHDIVNGVQPKHISGDTLLVPVMFIHRNF